MAEQMIKNLLEKKLILLKKLKEHLQKQNKAVDENDERFLAQILSAKEKVIESLIKMTRTWIDRWPFSMRKTESR